MLQSNPGSATDRTITDGVYFYRVHTPTHTVRPAELDSVQLAESAHTGVAGLAVRGECLC